jgi:RNA polymerase sigma-70 factor (ECF subfamily)
MSASDEELVAAIVDGDRNAFGELYRRRRPDVFRFAAHMTGDTAAAEDVTQDVFMAVIHEARRYEPGRAAVVSWLLGIARNHARRRLSRDRAMEALPEGPTDATTISPDPVAALTRERQTATLRRALHSLPVVYREAVVLCDLQELSYADAADALGCALGTVRSRLHRGRAMLESRLRGEQRSFARWPARDWVL